MTNKEIILQDLRTLSNKPNKKGQFIVEFEGKRLLMKSGKNCWGTIGAAKNALRLEIDNSINDWRERLKIIQDLEKEGIIKYKEI